MKKYIVVAILLSCSLAFADDRQASCVIAEKSIIGRSASGVLQVSNVREIEITCHAPARPALSGAKTVSESTPLRLKTVAYQIGGDGAKTIVPSFSKVTGGGFCFPPPQNGGECQESLLGYLKIPIDPAEAIAEYREIVKKIEATTSFTPEEHQRSEDRIRNLESHPDELAEIVSEDRPGDFLVECRLMDRDGVWAVGQIELEIVFKGHAFDDAFGKAPSR